AGLGIDGRVGRAGRAADGVGGWPAAVLESAREEGVPGRGAPPPLGRSPVRASKFDGWRPAGGGTPDGLAGVEPPAGRTGGVAGGPPPRGPPARPRAATPASGAV